MNDDFEDQYYFEDNNFREYDYDTTDIQNQDEFDFDNEQQDVFEKDIFSNDTHPIEQIGGTGSTKADIRNPSLQLSFMVSTAIKMFTEQHLIRLSKGEINILEQESKKTLNRQYKNPYCFILGFYILSSNTIDRVKFKEVCKLIPDFPFPVKDYDILRYARFWIR